MKHLILASGSPHRKKLLKLLGVKFIVRPSKIKEDKNITTTCADFVKQNALRKAQDVAKHVSSGIVIGADTIVYLGQKRIIGKPRNLAHAKRTLKMICRLPQWVYTGLALVDARTKKTVVDYEKTKIVMNHLSDAEIERYYSHVSPLDKAGGFDIQGKGGLLIKRIEGCYFNVIGLPLSKLAAMLKKFGVIIFLLPMMIFVGGCATEYNLATGQEESLIYDTDKEVSLGESISRQLEKDAKMITDVDVNERVSAILRKIVEVCDRKDVVYSIKVIDEDKVNAVSLPGGYVYVYKGLIDNVKNDDELACVIAHEVAHITARHSIKKMQSLYGYTFLKLLAVQTTRSADVAQGMDLAFASIFTEYSREDELQADRLGVKYAKKAGYNPAAMADFLKKLSEIQAKEPSRQFSYWRTHPHIPQRIAAVNQAVSGSLEFKDYLNLVGEE